MENVDHHPILGEIEAYISEEGLSLSAFGELSVGDPRFVFDLKAGREPRRKTVEKVKNFMCLERPRKKTKGRDL